MKFDLTRLEHHFAHKAVIEKTVPGKYSLSEAAKRVNLPIYHLNILRIRGMIKSEQIGRAHYFDLDVLKQELKKENVAQYLTENYRLYSRE